MREILFRGMRKDNNEWIFGELIKTDIGWMITNYNDIDMTASSSQGRFLGDIIATAIIPETVGQFTGLLDKNGNKIFEGDKFAFVNGQVREDNEWIDNVEEYFVEYMSDSTGFLLTNGLGYDSRNCKKLDCDIIYYSEVIGNIHQSLTPNK